MKYIETEQRPWGSFYVIHDEKKYKLKRIEVESGQRLSYQYHKKRAETWIIIEGEATVMVEDKIKKYNEGQTVIIPKGAKHRVENTKSDKLIFIEVQTGTYFGEDDIVRIEDDYNRS
jgi:mannose-6-phosphate isomerase